jgi:hypothetical protein
MGNCERTRRYIQITVDKMTELLIFLTNRMLFWPDVVAFATTHLRAQLDLTLKVSGVSPSMEQDLLS